MGTITLFGVILKWRPCLWTQNSAWLIDIHQALAAVVIISMLSVFMQIRRILGKVTKWPQEVVVEGALPVSSLRLSGMMGGGCQGHLLFFRKEIFWVQWYFILGYQPISGFRGSLDSLWGSSAERLGTFLWARASFCQWEIGSPERVMRLFQVTQQSVLIQQIPLGHPLCARHSSRCWEYSCE